MNSQHLFPARGPREPGVTHFSGYIEVRLNIVLPGLPLLDALFGDAQGRVHIQSLITVKNSSAITDKALGRAGSGEGSKEHLKKVPLICVREILLARIARE